MSNQLEMFDFISAGILHFGMGITLLIANSCMGSSTLTPPPVTVVTAMSAPLKQKTAMPDRATKAPEKKQPKPKEPKPEKPKPEAKPEPKPEPKKDALPPPEQTVPEAPVEEPEEADNTEERDALLRELEMQDLLNDFTAPEDEVDRPPTSADGTDAPSFGPIGSGATDPELAAYVQRCRMALLANWTPLPAILEAHPEYKVVLKVIVDSTGKMSSPQIIQSSGDGSFDQAAILAVHKTGSLPPPPEKWAASAATGVQITLAASDK